MSRRLAFGISAILVAAMTVAGGWAWLQLPAGSLVPAHWNAAGRVDGHAGPWILFLTPTLTIGVDLLMVVLFRVEPRRRNVVQGITVWPAVRAPRRAARSAR